MKWIYTTFAIGSIFICELMILFNQLLGLLMYSILIGFFLIKIDKDAFFTLKKKNIRIKNGNLVSKEDELLIFLMIVPILRITEFFIDFNELYNILIFYFMMVGLTIYYLRKFLLEKKYNYHKRKGTLSYLIFIFIIVFFIEYFFSIWENSFIYIIPFIAYSEEILFRGGIFHLIKDSYNSLISVFLTSGIYTMFSFSHGVPLIFLIFSMSLIISYSHFRTNSLKLPIFFNVILQLLLVSFL